MEGNAILLILFGLSAATAFVLLSFGVYVGVFRFGVCGYDFFLLGHSLLLIAPPSREIASFCFLVRN